MKPFRLNHRYRQMLLDASLRSSFTDQWTALWAAHLPGLFEAVYNEMYPALTRRRMKVLGSEFFTPSDCIYITELRAQRVKQDSRTGFRPATPAEPDDHWYYNARSVPEERRVPRREALGVLHSPFARAGGKSVWINDWRLPTGAWATPLHHRWQGPSRYWDKVYSSREYPFSREHISAWQATYEMEAHTPAGMRLAGLRSAMLELGAREYLAATALIRALRSVRTSTELLKLWPEGEAHINAVGRARPLQPRPKPAPDPDLALDRSDLDLLQESFDATDPLQD